jgi:glutamate synthase (NADPH/NADH) small chain
MIDPRITAREAEARGLYRSDTERDACGVGSRLVAEFDAVCLAIGAGAPRELPVPGRDLAGVHLAMDYLTGCNRAAADPSMAAPITASGKRVVILGGGDTGADCLGWARSAKGARRRGSLMPGLWAGATCRTLVDRRSGSKSIV